MIRAISLLALFAGFTFAHPARADPKAVVELFTSQGCSSCRAADAYFAELVKRGDVIALSLHVDYWDYLGWRDTFGVPEHSARQRQYAAVHGSSSIYTPQVTVNGMHHVVGSDRKAVEAAVAASALHVPVSIDWASDKLEIQVERRPLPGSRPATIWLVLFTGRASVQISGGENAGAAMTYHNVVRAIRPIGMWDGNAVKITLPADEIMVDQVDGCAVIVQEDLPTGPGAILGAAQITSR